MRANADRNLYLVGLSLPYGIESLTSLSEGELTTSGLISLLQTKSARA